MSKDRENFWQQANFMKQFHNNSQPGTLQGSEMENSSVNNIGDYAVASSSSRKSTNNVTKNEQVGDNDTDN